MRLRLAIVAFLATVGTAEAQEPTEMSEVETGTQIYNVESLRLPPTNGVLVISGERMWNSFFVSAERIEFEPGARLVFTEDAVAMRGNLYVMANEIVSRSQENPGIITWRPGPLGVPPDRGSAPGAGGYPGDERPGNSGQAGASGNQGYAGASGPSVTLVVGDPSSPVVVDLRGQAGGTGGRGEQGGRGGVGGNGRQASQSPFDCRRGAGDGGRGGAGGAGGPGGTGGPGGRGGTFILMTERDALPLASGLFRVRLAPGAGGSGGAGGEGGAGGDGGRGGRENLPYCRGNGSNGQPGAPGSTGRPGGSGPQGGDGDYIIGGISEADLVRVLQD